MRVLLDILMLGQGDFVDRGYNSLEVFTILLLLKARYASFVHFLACIYLVIFINFKIIILFLLQL